MSNNQPSRGPGCFMIAGIAAGIAGMVLLSGLVIFIIAGATARQRGGGLAVENKLPRPAAPRYDDALAIRACNTANEAVRVKLRSPGTARFPDCITEAYEYTIAHGEKYPEMLSIYGHVDAENAFGGTRRADFIVFLRVEHDGRIQITEVAIR